MTHGNLTQEKQGRERQRGHEAKGIHNIEAVKRVLIADEVLDVLGELQKNTQPKMDMRYWVEGAVLTALQEPGMAEKVATAARQRLRKALDQHS